LLTSGMVAENHADHLRALSAAWHKTIGHGYAQNLLCTILSVEQDGAFIAQNNELLEQATGQRPPRCGLYHR
ncbi:MAG TPA: hypothetical protein VLA45_17105, partial [Paracoccaceae bacterium]|nr:hypothetical protein [Paracoccaceae bacterium]